MIFIHFCHNIFHTRDSGAFHPGVQVLPPRVRRADILAGILDPTWRCLVCWRKRCGSFNPITLLLYLGVQIPPVPVTQRRPPELPAGDTRLSASRQGRVCYC